MIFGAIAFFVYACALCRLIMRYKLPASIVASHPSFFLAFPAIFPANATLVKRHEQRKKKRAASHASFAGAKQLALDAADSRARASAWSDTAKLMVPNKSRIVFGGASCFGVGLRD